MAVASEGQSTLNEEVADGFQRPTARAIPVSDAGMQARDCVRDETHIRERKGAVLYSPREERAH
jgi:hypothetical protein